MGNRPRQHPLLVLWAESVAVKVWAWMCVCGVWIWCVCVCVVYVCVDVRCVCGCVGCVCVDESPLGEGVAIPHDHVNTYHLSAPRSPTGIQPASAPTRACAVFSGGRGVAGEKLFGRRPPAAAERRAEAFQPRAGDRGLATSPG